MEVGTKIKINKLIGTLIKVEGSYGLIKFDCGTFCYNLNGITKKQIL